MEISRKLLTIPEAALALRMGRSYVYGLVADGTLVSVKLGRSRRIPTSAVDDYIKRLLEEQVNSKELVQ